MEKNIKTGCSKSALKGLAVRLVARAHFGALFFALFFALFSFGCSNQQRSANSPTISPTPQPSELAVAPSPEAANATATENFAQLGQALKPWKGDYDGMVQRRMIRVLVVYNKMAYTVDRGAQQGLTYDVFKEFEKVVNEKLKTRNLTVNVVFVPVGREQLIPALLDGRGDIAVANLTVTEQRQEKVDFSDPPVSDVSKLIVTGPSAPPVANLDDLAGKEVYVKVSSSYYKTLRDLNEKFKQAGKPQMKLVPADELLEDDDLLEMVNAGLIPMIVIDSHLGEFWSKVFDQIALRKDLALSTGGQKAWAFRKNSPQLREVVNEFIKTHGKGTLFGNMMFNRYLKSTDWVKNSTTEEELKKFRATVDMFRKYGAQYDMDWLLMMAQGYQESQLDQSRKSHRGAVGVMQLLPTTAADPNVNIRNIDTAENNIHAGVKYMRFVVNQYYKNEPMDRLNKGLFAFASYNAGPGRVAGLRREAQKLGLNPNVWFYNVEVVAAKEIGRETVQYVSNIYKYYIAYRQVVAQMEKKQKAGKKS